MSHLPPQDARVAAYVGHRIVSQPEVYPTAGKSGWFRRDLDLVLEVVAASDLRRV